MQEGLYGVHFVTPIGGGAGVVVLSDGQLKGGDSALFYTGTYSLNGSSFTATVRTARHTPIEDVISVFGTDEVTITLTGEWKGSMITAEGQSPQAPGIKFEAHLKLLAG
ncbi:MAG: hypothetical protein ACK4FG_01380 [Brevundimonas sp.]